MRHSCAVKLLLLTCVTLVLLQSSHTFSSINIGSGSISFCTFVAWNRVGVHGVTSIPSFAASSRCKRIFVSNMKNEKLRYITKVYSNTMEDDMFDSLAEGAYCTIGGSSNFSITTLPASPSHPLYSTLRLICNHDFLLLSSHFQSSILQLFIKRITKVPRNVN